MQPFSKPEIDALNRYFCMKTIVTTKTLSLKTQQPWTRHFAV